MATPKEQQIRLIPCDKACSHQQQGYCALDQITRITSCESNGCGYFMPADQSPLNAGNGLLDILHAKQI